MVVRLAACLLPLALTGCLAPTPRQATLAPAPRKRSQDPVFQGALAQLREPATYDDSYRKIAFPGGDVPKGVGACSDVVVRALRNVGIDMQAEVSRDHRKRAYPAISEPDPNIDHRRVRNLTVYFERHFDKIGTDAPPSEWKPGDIVVWKMYNGRDHTGVVSDRLGRSGWPAVIHNTGQVAEEDVLHLWNVVGHYRASIGVRRFIAWRSAAIYRRSGLLDLSSLRTPASRCGSHSGS